MANNVKTVSELLLAIRDTGISEIERFLNIQHNPMIGGMYEGLTKDIAQKVIFKELDLRVVSGKIKNSEGLFSKQIDCMIVTGSGDKLPFSDEYIYDINNVIMVIEVKKNLYSEELSKGYDNLKSVIEVQANDFRPLRVQPVCDAFSSIAGKPITNIDNISTLSFQEQMLYHLLVVEELFPIRVIFGYSGFSTEKILRKKFIDYISDNLSKGYGPQSLPNLIIAGENSIIKTNGMPYGLNIQDIDDYCWMASYRRNPILLLLELLWTRLSSQYNLPVTVFGNEIQEEALFPLLTIHALGGDKKGWMYTEIPYLENQIAYIDKNERDWEPTILSNEEFVLMNLLCDGQVITVDEFASTINSSDKANEIIDHLSNNRLIYVDGLTVKLLTKECVCIIDSEYGYIAADNYDNRLMNWIHKKRQERKSNNE